MGRAAAFHHKQEALLRSDRHRARKSEKYKEKKKELLQKKNLQNPMEAMGSV